MNKEQQDKLWNELSEESKECILSINKELDEEYEKYKKEGEDTLASYSLDKVIMLESLFGEHNLNPKPQIKTWEDVENYLEIIPDFKEIIHNLDVGCCSQKVTNKIIATYKISRIIELGYGGMVSEEEWKDIDIEKWCIIPCNKIDDIQCIVFYFHSDKRFIAFHEEKQAEEFMSYESNCQLVQQYYLM